MVEGPPPDSWLAPEGSPFLTGLTLDFVPTPAPGVDSCELDGELLLWRGTTLHRLNAMGTLVWRCFDGQMTVAGIGRTLAEAFNAPERDVHHDLSELCRELFEVGLLDGGPSEAPDPPPFIRMGRPPSAPLDSTVVLPYSTGRFLAFEHDFAIRTDDTRLARHFDRSFRSFAVPGSPARWYSVVSTPEAAERYRIYLDDEGLLATNSADGVARYLLWHVNYSVINGESPHLLIHAAGAAMRQQAVVLPGDMNAGKTTLVAGLVLDGLQFLTDELVALNLSTGLVDAYPRPLNIEDTSWNVLSGLEPADRNTDDPLPERVWHVEPTSIRPDAVSRSAPLAWVVAPKYEEGAPTRLQPMSRAEAAVLLHRHSFNHHRFGSAGTRALVTAVSRARCARLVSGNLDDAVGAVRRFLEEKGSP